MHPRLIPAVMLAIFVFGLLFMFNIYNSGEQVATVTFTTTDGSTHIFKCEVASEYDERSAGLSGRYALPPDEGMLFVFEYNSTSPFWMKDMLIPLDIIFIAENGTVINVHEAPVPQPGSELEEFHPDAPYRWVVEINYGLSQQLGITPGTAVEIEP